MMLSLLCSYQSQRFPPHLCKVILSLWLKCFFSLFFCLFAFLPLLFFCFESTLVLNLSLIRYDLSWVYIALFSHFQLHIQQLWLRWSLLIIHRAVVRKWTEIILPRSSLVSRPIYISFPSQRLRSSSLLALYSFLFMSVRWLGITWGFNRMICRRRLVRHQKLNDGMEAWSPLSCLSWIMQWGVKGPCFGHSRQHKRQAAGRALVNPAVSQHVESMTRGGPPTHTNTPPGTVSYSRGGFFTLSKAVMLLTWDICKIRWIMMSEKSHCHCFRYHKFLIICSL